MPPQRTPMARPPVTKPVKTERTHEENQERAYIAASRRSDRSLEARVESARRASEIHKKRTGRSLRVTENDVLNEEMYEEEDDDYSRYSAVWHGSAGFNYGPGFTYGGTPTAQAERFKAYYRHQQHMQQLVNVRYREAVGNQAQVFPGSGQNAVFTNPYMHQQMNTQMGYNLPMRTENPMTNRHQPYPAPNAQSQNRSMSVSMPTSQTYPVGSLAGRTWSASMMPQGNSLYEKPGYPRRHMSLPTASLSSSGIENSGTPVSTNASQNVQHLGSPFTHSPGATSPGSPASPLSNQIQQPMPTSMIAASEAPFYPFSGELNPETMRYLLGQSNDSNAYSLMGNALGEAPQSLYLGNDASCKATNDTSAACNPNMLLPNLFDNQSSKSPLSKDVSQNSKDASYKLGSEEPAAGMTSFVPTMPLNSEASLVTKSAEPDPIDDLLNESTSMSSTTFKNEFFEENSQWLGPEWQNYVDDSLFETPEFATTV